MTKFLNSLLSATVSVCLIVVVVSATVWLIRTIF
jgi:hypothetical protein